MSIFVRHLCLRDASDQMLLASHARADHDIAYRLKEAREDVIRALSGCAAGTDTDEARADLIDLIETALLDSFDVDWTAKDGAEAVLAALLDTVAPLPAEKEAAA